MNRASIACVTRKSGATMLQFNASLAARLRPLAAAAAATCFVTGCAVGPNFATPTAPAAAGYTTEPLPAKTVSAEVTGGAAQQFVRDMDIPGQWWTLFRSEALNALVEEAFTQNPDVDAARAALRAAHEAVRVQQGAYFPSIEASYSPSRQQIASPLASPAASGDDLFNLHTAQVTVSYTLDLFGGNRRQVESLVAQADAQRFQLEATYLTLSTNVVAAAIQEAALRGQLAATEEIIGIQQKTLGLLHKQYELGQVAMADVAAQEAALAQARATLPPLQKQLAQQRDLLARLTGRFPSEKLLAEFDLASLQLPEALPVSLPSKLVEQRPDVRAAQAQWHAASAAVGVAVAARLPNITLSASYGSSAEIARELFSTSTAFWSLAANITQPIFAGGALLHRQRGAEAAYDQAAAQYRGTVLSAFQNVADTLHALKSDADSLSAALAAERAAEKSLKIAQRQLELGDISYLTQLNAQQAYQQARIGLVQAQANRYADTTALFQAMGGGWWHRGHADPNAARKPATS
ncbi:histidine kinase [Pandoraea terrae]|uniref:Histidine kinase n=1 Tax=Pandoraea terrae TaxID=1537710 RepID=A0A5E4S5H3_9BURK|nr:efflux transporter outer membrane subunit [Pandoraea terrae]VVD71026.1 histidine kinase [Pandoraea terrae]